MLTSINLFLYLINLILQFVNRQYWLITSETILCLSLDPKKKTEITNVTEEIYQLQVSYKKIYNRYFNSTSNQLKNNFKRFKQST